MRAMSISWHENNVRNVKAHCDALRVEVERKSSEVVRMRLHIECYQAQIDAAKLKGKTAFCFRPKSDVQ